MNYKTDGVVIRRNNFSEADRILTIFTERFGKVKAIAKGVRKISAKMAGALEPFMFTELQLFEGRNFYTVTGAAIKEDYPSIHTDVKKMADAFYLGELVDKFEKDNHKSPEVFLLLLSAFRSLDQHGAAIALRVFEIRLLKLSGFWPDLTECRHCKKRLELEENYWDGTEGGIICLQCQRMFRHGRAISNDLIKVFRLIESEGFDLVGKLAIKPELQLELESVVKSYLREVLESEIKSERLIKVLN